MTVLAYPAIAAEASAMSMPRRRFAAQLDLLADMGVPVLSLAGVVAVAGAGVAITFDGGQRETYTEAYPLLAARGLVATVYMVTGPLATARRLPAGGEAMSWAMLRELSQAGWTIGSQGVRSQSLTALAPEPLRTELSGSRQALEDGLGVPCRHFCPPAGDLDQRVQDAIRAAGYSSTALTLTRRHPLAGAPGVVGRVGITRKTAWWSFRLRVRGWDPRIPRIARRPPESLGSTD